MQLQAVLTTFVSPLYWKSGIPYWMWLVTNLKTLFSIINIGLVGWGFFLQSLSAHCVFKKTVQDILDSSPQGTGNQNY